MRTFARFSYFARLLARKTIPQGGNASGMEQGTPLISFPAICGPTECNVNRARVIAFHDEVPQICVDSSVPFLTRKFQDWAFFA